MGELLTYAAFWFCRLPSEFKICCLLAHDHVACELWYTTMYLDVSITYMIILLAVLSSPKLNVFL